MLDRPIGRHKHNGIEYDSTGKKGKYKYLLARDYSFDLGCPCEPFESDYMKVDQFGICTLYIGYASDGPSGITYDSETFMRGAWEHDAFYQMFREGKIGIKYRQHADEKLRETCLEDGMWAFRANYVYWGVHLFAGFAARPTKAE